MASTPEPAVPWTVARLLARSRAILRKEGVQGLWARMLGELGYRRLLILARSLDEPIPDLSARIPLDFGLLALGDLDGYLAFHGDDPRPQLEQRFRLNEVCFLARHERRIVCANWACTGSHYIRYIRYDFPIADDEVYLYDSYTHPEFRGLGVAPALAGYVLRHYRGTPVRRAVTAVIPENRANLRARAKSGFRVVGRMGYVGSHRWCRHFHRVSR
jgi:GNAT superfamily N-acetyltransferase